MYATPSNVIVIAGVILALVLCYFVAAPFLPAITWSITLAVLFLPLQNRLEQSICWPGVAAAMCVLIAAFLVVVPGIVVFGLLVEQVVQSAGGMAQIINSGDWVTAIAQYPSLAPIANQVERWLDVDGLMNTFQSHFAPWGGSFIQLSIQGLVTLLITFFFLFYLLRDRKSAMALLETLLPFTPSEFAMLTRRVADTIFAAVYGILVVAAIQGALGGLMFWWLGLPSPLFWAAIMALLALVPFLGASIIWVPTAIILALDGNILSALLLIAWGTIVIGLIDNILYPILVGSRLRFHSALAFIAILGGLLLFGPSGIVMGPVILAVSQSLLLMAKQRLTSDQKPLASP